MEKVCKHKYIHLRTESYYIAYRNSDTYYLTDYFFCEKCLHEEKVIKRESVNHYNEKKPDWAMGITKKIYGDGY